MKLLSIDTTTMQGSVALTDGEGLIAQEQLGVPGTHSARLMASIEQMLFCSGWTLRDIQGIAVAVGPGSFTGLRIGLATVKGIALALDIPLCGVSSLAALALAGAGFAGTVVPLIDARRGELYAAAYRVPLHAPPKVLMREAVLAPALLAQRLRAIPGELLLLGDGALAEGAGIAKAVGRRVSLARPVACVPQAAHLALLALPRLARGRANDPAELVPNYVRASDAEIGFRGKASRPRAWEGRGKR